MDFQLLGLEFRVRCQTDRSMFLLESHYGHLRSRIDNPILCYQIDQEDDSTFTIERPGFRVARLVERKLLLALDYDLMIKLQRHREDLLFLHAAALELDGKAILFPARAGTGKSTLAWRLQDGRFRYLSDELAPIDPRTYTVSPFPRAICLKTPPPLPHRLPRGVIRTTGTIHVPNSCLRVPAVTEPVELGALVFPTRVETVSRARVRRLSRAEGAALIYSNALNPKAHPSCGLDIVIDVAKRFPCFEVEMGDLSSTAEVVHEAISMEI